MANCKTLRLELDSTDYYAGLAPDPSPIVIVFQPNTVGSLLDTLGEEIRHFECDMLPPQKAMKAFRERLSAENFGHWNSHEAVDTLFFRIIRHEDSLQIESSKNEEKWTTVIPRVADHVNYTNVLFNRMLEFTLNTPIHNGEDTRLRSSRKRKRKE
jgi:hypothetical protein